MSSRIESVEDLAALQRAGRTLAALDGQPRPGSHAGDYRPGDGNLDPPRGIPEADRKIGDRKMNQVLKPDPQMAGWYLHQLDQESHANAPSAKLRPKI